MTTGRRLIYSLTAIVLATSVSCTSSSMDPSPRVAQLQVSVMPNPLVQNGIGACTTGSGQPPSGVFRLFPHQVTVEETDGVGVAVESHRVTALVGAQEFQVFLLDAASIGDRFNDCGGAGNRVEARARRCNTDALFCSPLNAAVPNQLRLEFTAMDDNGNSITGVTTVNLAQ